MCLFINLFTHDHFTVIPIKFLSVHNVRNFYLLSNEKKPYFFLNIVGLIYILIYSKKRNLGQVFTFEKYLICEIKISSHKALYSVTFQSALC